MIDINDLTLGQVKEIKSLANCNEISKSGNTGSNDSSHWVVGKNYFIRTVTMIQVGELKKVTDKELVLSKASWIADTGKLSDSLIKGSFDEVELFPQDLDVIIGRGALIDALQVNFKLPSETK